MEEGTLKKHSCILHYVAFKNLEMIFFSFSKFLLSLVWQLSPHLEKHEISIPGMTVYASTCSFIPPPVFRACRLLGTEVGMEDSREKWRGLPALQPLPTREGEETGNCSSV